MEGDGEKTGGYWVVSLVDAEDEDQLGEEQSGGSIADDTRLVALHGSQTEQEDDGDEEEAQGHSHCAPGQDFDRQDLAILKCHDSKHTRSKGVFVKKKFGII